MTGASTVQPEVLVWDSSCYLGLGLQMTGRVESSHWMTLKLVLILSFSHQIWSPLVEERRLLDQILGSDIFGGFFTKPDQPFSSRSST